jgi:glycosyltransferase involved in cell wall biosynthesis
MSQAAPHVLVMPSWYPTPDDPVAGIFFREQALAMHAAGLRVRVAVPEQYSLSRMYGRFRRLSPVIERTDDEGMPTWRWAICYGPDLSPQGFRSRSFLIGGEHCFRRYLAEHGMPDVIHAQSVLWAGVLAAHLKRRFGVPFVVTEHSSAYREGLVGAFQCRLTTEVLRAADVRTFVSPQLGEGMEAQFGEVARPWRWTPNLVDERFRPAGSDEARTRVPFVFLSVGMLVWYKGYPDLLHAFALRFRGDPGMRLRIVGDGPLRPELEGLTQELGISSQVDFLGALDRERVLTEMQGADALVHPSPFETFGIVLAEALACGLPVVAASEGGPRSIIHEGNGMLVPPQDREALAGAMAAMRDGIGAYDAQAIREDCLRRFSSQAVVDMMKDVYAEALEADTRPGVAPAKGGKPVTTVPKEIG